MKKKNEKKLQWLGLRAQARLTSQVNNPQNTAAISALQRLRGGAHTQKKLITKVFIFVLEPELLPNAKGTVNFKDHFLHNHVPRLRLPRAVLGAKQAFRLQYGRLFV